ncbi:MAG: hypothetical protein U0Q18_09915 [Bryobacteraceae bacterium]
MFAQLHQESDTEPDHSTGDPFAWTDPHCPFRIECSAAVLEQLRHDVQSGRDDRHGPLEIGGVLFGRTEKSAIRITALQPLERLTGEKGFVLSPEEEARFAALACTPTAAGKFAGLQALGWYHSHIYSGILLTERDLAIHDRIFPGPKQVALILHPSSRVSQIRAGFFFREASGSVRTHSSYREFVVEVPRPEDSAQKSTAKATRKKTPRPAPAELTCPKCGSQRLRRSHRQGLLERLTSIFGYFPQRCQECLTRSYLKTAPALPGLRGRPPKRHAERMRARLRTRREILLWGGGIIGFLLLLRYLIREPLPKSDQP